MNGKKLTSGVRPLQQDTIVNHAEYVNVIEGIIANWLIEQDKKEGNLNKYPQLFKPEDFSGSYFNYQPQIIKQFSDKAQSIFEKWLEKEGKIVYGYLAGNAEIMYGPNKHQETTHIGLLICVEEIKPTIACEHKHVHIGNDYILCKGCDKKLKVNWTVVE